MAKKAPSTSSGQAPVANAEHAPAAAPAFKRGFFSLTFTFSLFIGLLLFGLLVVVTLVVNSQLRTDLTREVAERGNSVARSIAGKAVEPVVQADDLTLRLLAKDSVEEGDHAAEVKPSFLTQALGDLQASFTPRASAKNEGIARVVVLKQDKDQQQRVADSGFPADPEKAPPLPQSQQDPAGLEPFPLFEQGGQQYYDIAEPIVEPSTGKGLGEVHLYLRRDVITDAVRVATTRMVMVMVLSLIIGLLLLFAIVRMLLRPVGFLVRGVSAVAVGNFNVHIALQRSDELGELVDAYNGMAKNLKEKEAIQEALAKYTSKDLVNQMLSDKAQLGLGGQKVYATIFFSVVRGMHALSSTMDAEEYVALVNEYLEVKTDVVMRNGGSIDKFIGDEVMAIWGLNGGDRAEMAYQATKAGVECQQAVEKLNADRVARGEQPFLISIGINNGSVVSGNMGSSVKMDYTVLGGAVNLAARLGLVAAQGGQTIISHSVYDLVADRFKIDKLAPMQLKGIKEPVPLYWPRKATKKENS
jgi:class 3 adenylate cyclase